MNVVYFKLLNGEDIMANLIEETDHHYLIDFPYKFLMSVDSRSNILSTSIVRWIPMKDFMEQPLKIIKHSVISMGNVSKDIEDYYLDIRKETVREFEEEDYSDIGRSIQDDSEQTMEELVDTILGKGRTIH